MKLNLILIATIVLTITVCLSVDGKGLKLRPMSARQVYRVLREAGREDAIPEGSVITQGLAAIKGFALGITKGVGGSLLFDLVTSNATTEFLNGFNYSALVPDFNSINYTALLPTFNLTELFGAKGGNATNTTITITQQEICFTSRSLNDIDDDGKMVEEQGQSRQTPTTSPPPTTTGGTSPGTTSPTPTGTLPPTTSPTISPTTGTLPPTTSPTTSPTTTGTATTTSTAPTPGTTNCIVIQKQKPRRRRAINY